MSKGQINHRIAGSRTAQVSRSPLGGVAGIVSDASITAIDAAGWTVTAAPSDYVSRSARVVAPGFNATGGSIALPPISIPMTGRMRQPTAYPYVVSIPLLASTSYMAERINAADMVLGNGIVNNSTSQYPKCIANWADGDRLIVGNTVTVYLTAWHWYGIACIIGTADDGDGHTATAITTTQVILPGNDANKIVGYVLTFDVSGFTDKRDFDVNARVYPKRGTAGSILDSSAVTTITGSKTTRNFGPRTYRRDVTLFNNPIYAYVSLTGDDGTGAVNTVAASALSQPFATIAAARTALKNSTLSGKVANSDDGCIVRLLAGNHALNTVTTFTNSATTAVIIEAAPGESRDTVTITSNATAPSMRTNFLRVRNVNWVRGGAGYVVGMVTAPICKVFTEDCVLNNGGQGTNFFGSGIASIRGGIVRNGGTLAIAIGATTVVRHELVRGVTLDTVPTAAATMQSVDGYNAIGNTIHGGGVNNSTNSADNSVIAFNRFLKGRNAAISFQVPSGGNLISGVVIAQNVVEYTYEVSNPAVRVSGDSELISMDNVLMIYNTTAGMDTFGRENAFYDDSAGTTRRTHTWVMDRFNGKSQSNCKIDRFVANGQNNSDGPNRIGGFEHAVAACGVGYNHVRYRNASSGDISFGPENFGIGTIVPTTNTPPGGDPLFVDYKGVTGTTASPVAGIGGGNYRVLAGSPYIAKVPGELQLLDFDLDGNPRPKTGFGTIGAYEYQSI